MRLQEDEQVLVALLYRQRIFVFVLCLSHSLAQSSELINLV